mgnify:CR=1 FL=1
MWFFFKSAGRYNFSIDFVHKQMFKDDSYNMTDSVLIIWIRK